MYLIVTGYNSTTVTVVTWSQLKWDSFIMGLISFAIVLFAEKILIMIPILAIF